MRKDIISKIVFQEESRFQGTLQSGEAFLSQLIEQTKKNKKQQLSGKDIFMLYDTYGFPVSYTHLQEVNVKIIKLDDQERKIGLSIKQTLPRDEEKERTKEREKPKKEQPITQTNGRTTLGDVFGDTFNNLLNNMKNNS